jgi:hypothetical protein
MTSKASLCGLVLLAACSNEYRDGALNLSWTPPQGVKLESETTEGPITTAHFSGGVEVRSIAGAPPAVTGDLDALKASLLATSKIAINGDVRTGRAGSIPAGPTVRWETQSGTERSLLYYVPGKDRYVVIGLTASAAAFDHKSDKLELSMSTLKLK